MWEMMQKKYNRNLIVIHNTTKSWCVTTQILVMLLIGHATMEISFNQSYILFYCVLR